MHVTARHGTATIHNNTDVCIDSPYMQLNFGHIYVKASMLGVVEVSFIHFCVHVRVCVCLLFFLLSYVGTQISTYIHRGTQKIFFYYCNYKDLVINIIIMNINAMGHCENIRKCQLMTNQS